MKRGKHAIVRAWLLVVLLALPSAARTAHILEEAFAQTEGSHSHHGHDCGSCLLCQFAFSAFTAADFADCDSPAMSAGSERIALLYDRPYCPALLSYALRGPPAHPVPVS